MKAVADSGPLIHLATVNQFALLQRYFSAISKLERRPNVTLANLQRYVEALGGRLEIRAVFREETREILS